MERDFAAYSIRACGFYVKGRGLVSIPSPPALPICTYAICGLEWDVVRCEEVDSSLICVIIFWYVSLSISSFSYAYRFIRSSMASAIASPIKLRPSSERGANGYHLLCLFMPRVRRFYTEQLEMSTRDCVSALYNGLSDGKVRGFKSVDWFVFFGCVSN